MSQTRLPGSNGLPGQSRDYFERPFSLAELYHHNTRFVRGVSSGQRLTDDELTWGIQGKAIKPYLFAQKIGLPKTSPPLERDLFEAIVSRHSVRQWDDQAITCEQLAALLRYGAGVVRQSPNEDQPAYARAAPSGGARYPLEIYPVVLSVQDVPTGIYHYNYMRHALDVLQQRESVRESLLPCALYPESVAGTAVVFFLTAVWERSMSKYADRGYRYTLLEAGHIAQNICLIASSLGLGTLCLAGWYEGAVEEFLGVDGLEESLVYSVLAGYPLGSEHLAPHPEPAEP